MESASSPVSVPATLDSALLTAAVHAGVAAASSEEDSAQTIAAAIGALHDQVQGIFPSVFVLEHGRLWLVSQRGYAVVPDGIAIERGVMGRAVRLGLGQVVPDVRADPHYVEGLPGVCSEVAVPLAVDGAVVGVFNLESERALPGSVLELLGPLIAVIARPTEALRSVKPEQQRPDLQMTSTSSPTLDSSRPFDLYYLCGGRNHIGCCPSR